MTDQAFYDGLAGELLGRWNRLRSFTGHRPSVGFHHEEILRETIRAMISPRFQLRSGFAFASKDNVSNQGDILIIDEADPAPYLFRQGDLVVVQPRALACVVEVKTTLSKRSFAESIENLASFQRVADEVAPRRHPATYVFAFGSPQFAPETLNRWYKRVTVPHELKNYPLAVLSLTRGTLWANLDSSGTAFGHYYIVGEEGPRPKAKGLAMFLASIKKQIEIRAGVDSNPYLHASMDGLRWSRAYLRYGVGIVNPQEVSAP